MAQSYTEQAQAYIGSSRGRSNLVDNMAGRNLLLACFHLPVELKRDPATGGWAAQWNDSLIARSDDSVASEVKTRWVGTVSAGPGRVLHEIDKVQIRKVLLAMDCVPIFAPQELVDRAYLGFCKQQLWPSFHNVDMLDLSHPCWSASAAVSRLSGSGVKRCLIKSKHAALTWPKCCLGNPYVPTKIRSRISWSELPQKGGTPLTSM